MWSAFWTNVVTSSLTKSSHKLQLSRTGQLLPLNIDVGTRGHPTHAENSHTGAPGWCGPKARRAKCSDKRGARCGVDGAYHQIIGVPEPRQTGCLVPWIGKGGTVCAALTIGDHPHLISDRCVMFTCACNTHPSHKQ